MRHLPALAVAIPLLVAAAISALTPLLRARRRILDAIAILTSAAVAAILAVILVHVAHGDSVYWFAGFRPRHGIAIGIDFEVGPLSAGLACLAASGAVRFQDQAAYASAVLPGTHSPLPEAVFPAEDAGVTAADLISGAISVAGAVLLACLALYWRRLPLLRRGLEPGAGLTGPIQAFQSGMINDYVTWIVLGVACLGGILAVTIR